MPVVEVVTLVANTLVFDVDFESMYSSCRLVTSVAGLLANRTSGLVFDTGLDTGSDETNTVDCMPGLQSLHSLLSEVKGGALCSGLKVF